jgi:hypothetical protein
MSASARVQYVCLYECSIIGGGVYGHKCSYSYAYACTSITGGITGGITRGVLLGRQRL